MYEKFACKKKKRQIENILDRNLVPNKNPLELRCRCNMYHQQDPMLVGICHSVQICYSCGTVDNRLAVIPANLRDRGFFRQLPLSRCSPTNYMWHRREISTSLIGCSIIISINIKWIEYDNFFKIFPYILWILIQDLLVTTTIVITFSKLHQNQSKNTSPLISSINSLNKQLIVLFFFLHLIQTYTNQANYKKVTVQK